MNFDEPSILVMGPAICIALIMITSLIVVTIPPKVKDIKVNVSRRLSNVHTLDFCFIPYLSRESRHCPLLDLRSIASIKHDVDLSIVVRRQCQVTTLWLKNVGERRSDVDKSV